MATSPRGARAPRTGPAVTGLDSGAMPLHTRLTALQTWVVATVAVTIALVYWPPANDAFALSKAAAAVLASGTLVIAGLARAGLRGAVHLPRRSAVTIALAAFTAGLLVATATSDNVLLSVLGTRGRYAGLLMYAAAIVLLLTTARRFDARTVRRVLVGIAAAGSVVGLLAVLEGAGFDPTGMAGRTRFGRATTFGNPNFTGAMAGIALAMTAALALQRDLDRRWRALAAIAFVVNAAGIVASRASQGYVAGAAGVWLVSLVWALEAPDRWRRPAIVTLIGGAVAGAGAVLAGLASVGPLASLGTQASFRLRGYYWDAAMGMLRDNPVTGVGLDRYGDYYRTYRPLEEAVRQSLERYADNPHSVLLGMFANGGIVLGITYLAFVVTVGLVLVRGLRRTAGADRQLLALVGAAWLVYQVQSLVSIDVPPFVVLHFVFAGCIVVLTATMEWRELALPWGAAVPERAAKGRKKPAKQGLRPVEYVVAAVAVIGVLGVGLAAVRPLRADAADRRATGLLRAKEYELAYQQVREAQRLADWTTAYYVTESQIDITRDDLAKAIGTLELAAERNPRDLEALVPAARASQRLDRFDDAVAWYERALEIEPQSPRLQLEAASAYNDAGQHDRAAELLQLVVEHAPATVSAWRELSQAYELSGDLPAAVAALERAVELSPDHEPSQVKLRRLKAQLA